MLAVAPGPDPGLEGQVTAAAQNMLPPVTSSSGFNDVITITMSGTQVDDREKDQQPVDHHARRRWNGAQVRAAAR